MSWQIDTKRWSVTVDGPLCAKRPLATARRLSRPPVGRKQRTMGGYYQLRLLEMGTCKLVRTHEFHAATQRDAIKVAVEAVWNAPMQLWHEGRMLNHWPADSRGSL